MVGGGCYGVVMVLIMMMMWCYDVAVVVARGESDGMNASPTSANCSSHLSTNDKHD